VIKILDILVADGETYIFDFYSGVFQEGPSSFDSFLSQILPEALPRLFFEQFTEITIGEVGRLCGFFKADAFIKDFINGLNAMRNS
jgi:hypothetical protein